MTKRAVIVAVLVVLSSSAFGSVWFVDKENTSGRENGLTWEMAHTTIQAAITASETGDEVWVAEGVYDEERDHAAGSVVMHDHIGLYGGFAGTESARDEREGEGHVTIIDGSYARGGGPAQHVIIGANNATLDRFTVSGGIYSLGRGAGMYNDNVSPSVTNCVFTDNQASQGGGMYNGGSASPSVANCVFAGNQASQGGGMYNGDGASPGVTNCTFTGNEAPQGGGGIYNYHASPTVTNCILWGNSREEIFDSWSNPVVTYCDVQGGYAGYGNIDADPLFWHAAGGDLRLRSRSLCVDAGTLAGAPSMDMVSVSRPQGSGVDMGAYELIQSSEAEAPMVSMMFPPEGACLGFTPVTLLGTARAVSPSTLVLVGVSDGGPCELATGLESWQHEWAPASPGPYRLAANALDNFGRSDAVYVNVTYDPEAPTAYIMSPVALERIANRTVTITGSAWGGDFQSWSLWWGEGEAPLSWTEIASGDSPVVDDTLGTWDTSGLTASGAHTLRLSVLGQAKQSEHLVVVLNLTGVVYVDEDNTSGVESGLTWATAYTTVQAGIDDAYSATVGGGEAAVWITEGVYDEARDNDSGSVLMAEGVHIYGGFMGSEVVRDERNWGKHVTIIDGSVARGGQAAYHVFIGADTAVLDGVTITGGNANGNSSSDRRGGGMYNDSCSPSVANCTFAGNSASAEGGGMYNVGSASPVVERCVFTENWAQTGGGVFLAGPSGLDKAGSGGSTRIGNCVFWNNAAKDGGGLAADAGALATVLNCTFADCSAIRGGGVYDEGRLTIINCILWAGSSIYGSPIIEYSDIEGGYAGQGNIDMAPLFVNRGVGNVRLRENSPCIDNGRPEGAPATSISGVSRPQGAGVDMGAYEYLDNDADGMADDWEAEMGVGDPAGDPDGDGYTNLEEFENRTDPLVANFDELVVEIQPPGGGSVVLSPAGGSYVHGTSVTLTAVTAGPGWVFDHWEGDLTGSENPATLTVDAAKSVTAVFIRECTLATVALPSGSGSIAIDPVAEAYLAGTGVTLTAVANDGWIFDHWTVNGVTSGSENPITLTMDADKGVMAVFVAITYTLTVAVEGNGTVEPAAGQHTYGEGSEVAVTATADAGWRFDRWEGDLTGSASPATVTMDADKTVTAVFVAVTHTLTVALEGDGTVQPAAGQHTYVEGREVAVTATADAGWRFDRWEGDLTGSATPATVTMDADKDVTAVFVAIMHTLTVAVEGNGTVEPAPGTYIHQQGSEVPIVATAATGWAFDRWEGDVADADAAETVVTMDSDKTVTAFFFQVDEVVHFADPNLEAAVRDALGVPEGDIYESEVAGMVSLDASGRGILDLFGLEKCIGLKKLYLDENEISDISAVVYNTGIDSGDWVDLRANPLSQYALCNHIPMLKDRDVYVWYDGGCGAEGEGEGEGEGEAAVTGVVRDVWTNEPVAGVQVKLLDVAARALLDSGSTSATGAYAVYTPDAAQPLTLRFSEARYDPRVIVGVYAPLALNVALVPIAPLAPTGVEAVAGAGEVLVRWDANREPDLAGYHVYRAASGEGFERVQVEPIAATAHCDRAVSEAEYTYHVTAMDADGNEGPPSEAVRVQTNVITVWLPDVQGEGGEEVRVPINVKNAGGISPQDMAISLEYDPELVNYVDEGSVRVEWSAITEHMDMVHSAPEAGLVNIQCLTPGSPLRGEGHLFDVYFTLREDTEPDQCSPVQFGAVRFYDMDAQLLESDATDTGRLCVSAQCNIGDVNSDGRVDGEDAILALKIGADLLEPNECQQIAADMNGDGIIDSADALMIQRWSAHMPINPPESGQKELRPEEMPLKWLLKDGEGKTVEVASEEVAPGETVTLPVCISDAEALSGLDLKISYTPDKTVVDLVDVQPGAVTGAFLWELNDEEDGDVQVSMCNPEGLPAGGGAVLELTFAVAETVPVGTALPVALRDVTVKGQYGEDFGWYITIAKIDGKLAVEDQSVLGVTPAEQEVESDSGSASFEVTNDGVGRMAWFADVSEDADWLTIESGQSGINEGTITVAYGENASADERTGAVQVTAGGAKESPGTVHVTQGGRTYTLTVKVQGNGSVTPGAGTHKRGAGAEVTFTAAAAEGWRFDHWEGALSGSTSPATLIVDADKTVTAVFVELFALTVEVSPPDGGSVSIYPSTGPYAAGTVVNLSATPNSLEWQFDHWEGDLSGSTSLATLTIDADKTVTAVFVKAPCCGPAGAPLASASPGSTLGGSMGDLIVLAFVMLTLLYARNKPAGQDSVGRGLRLLH